MLTEAKVPFIVNSYFWMILLTFHETFQDLSEARGGSILQNTLTVTSNTRFHFSPLFSIYNKVINGVYRIPQEWKFFISRLLEDRKYISEAL